MNWAIKIIKSSTISLIYFLLFQRFQKEVTKIDLINYSKVIMTRFGIDKIP